MQEFKRNFTMELFIESLLLKNPDKWITAIQLLVLCLQERPALKGHLDAETIKFYMEVITESYTSHPTVSIIMQEDRKIMLCNVKK